MTQGFAIAFPVISIIIYLIHRMIVGPREKYEYRHYAKTRNCLEEIEGYDKIMDEIDGFIQYHNDGLGFHCHQLGKNQKCQIFPIDKREFLESNTNAAKLYKKCMMHHIAWSRGVVPYDQRFDVKKLDPYQPYYEKYGEAEKIFYSHGDTQYERNCIRCAKDREDEYCKHCVFTQNKVAKSYLAQRLVNYKQENLTPYFGSGAYVAPAHDTTDGAVVKNKSEEGLYVNKWNCYSKSDFTNMKYDGYEEIEKLPISTTNTIECANRMKFLYKNPCCNCEKYNCFSYGLNKDFQF